MEKHSIRFDSFKKGVNTMYNFERHPNLVLKLNVPFALKDGEKIALDYAPARKVDGTVLVPAFIEGFGGKTEDFEGKKF